MAKIAVLGAGSWGSALSIVLSDNGHDVRLWTHRKSQADTINNEHKNTQYLDVTLPSTLKAYHSLKEAVEGVSAVLIVVPTQAIRDVCKQLNQLVSDDLTIIHASKGIEPETLMRVSEMIAQEMDGYEKEEIVVLSGPSHAEEVAKRQPTTVTVSSFDNEQACIAHDFFINESFRVYSSPEMIGIELREKSRNIIPIGEGISEGLRYGDNAIAALITRGLAEIVRLRISLGGNPLTFKGLPGVGDLIVTCTSVHSRNWR